jgi:hypothetical protein
VRRRIFVRQRRRSESLRPWNETSPRPCAFRKFHSPDWQDEAESLHREWRCLRSFMRLGCSSPTSLSRVVGLKPRTCCSAQLNLALRQASSRPRLRDSDRALLVWVVRLWPSLLDVVQIVQPKTVLRWHRAGFRTFWRWKSRNRVGRPKIDRELCELIQRISMENPLWGASRIHGELLKLGFKVAQWTVSKYMARGRRPPSQSWKTSQSR